MEIIIQLIDLQALSNKEGVSINELSYMLFRVSTCGHPGEYGSNISHETVDLTKHSTYMPYIPSDPVPFQKLVTEAEISSLRSYLSVLGADRPK